jgi:hypothetical protein
VVEARGGNRPPLYHTTKVLTGLVAITRAIDPAPPHHHPHPRFPPPQKPPYPRKEKPKQLNKKQVHQRRFARKTKHTSAPLWAEPKPGNTPPPRRQKHRRKRTAKSPGQGRRVTLHGPKPHERRSLSINAARKEKPTTSFFFGHKARHLQEPLCIIAAISAQLLPIARSYTRQKKQKDRLALPVVARTCRAHERKAPLGERGMNGVVKFDATKNTVWGSASTQRNRKKKARSLNGPLKLKQQSWPLVAGNRATQPTAPSHVPTPDHGHPPVTGAIRKLSEGRRRGAG